MAMCNRDRAEQALFEAVSDDGTRWLFVVTDDRWTITRNGEMVAAGTADRESIDAGVRRFRSLAAAVASPGRRDATTPAPIEVA